MINIQEKLKIKEGYGIYRIYYFSDGDKYEGEWKNDKREGYGIYYSDRDKYEGEWKNDLKDGYGIYYYSNGNKGGYNIMGINIIYYSSPYNHHINPYQKKE